MPIDPTDPEYHRRRAEMEMHRALHALQPSEALAHLELARIHREKRQELAMVARPAVFAADAAIFRTDKES
jgi:hypothetical protein